MKLQPTRLASLVLAAGLLVAPVLAASPPSAVATDGDDNLNGGPGDYRLEGDDAMNGLDGNDRCSGGRSTDTQTNCETFESVP